MDRRGGRRGHQRGSCPAPGVRLGGRGARARRSAERVERGRRHAGGPRAPCGQRGVRSDRQVRHRSGDPAPAAGGQGRRCGRRGAGADHGAGGRAARAARAAAGDVRAHHEGHADRCRDAADEKAAQPDPSAEGVRALRAGAGGGEHAAGPGGQRAGGGSAGARDRGRPQFVLAQYTLGSVHQALGNRWKAAAQFRASTQLDPTYPGALQGAGRPVPGRAPPALRPGDRGLPEGDRPAPVLRRRLRGARRGQGGQG